MRILIAEGNDETRVLLSSYLEQECFAVDTVSNGKEVASLIEINEYDILLLDCILPEKDGVEICKEIRQRGKVLPILILSTITDCTNKIILLNAGADDYITKPFSLPEVCARIRALLRRPYIIVPTVITVAHITIDSGRQKVFCEGNEVYLTRKEFILLEYLARNEGQVLSRGMIMEHVWNMESDPFSNTIEAHIFNLRKKIAQQGTEIIHTIPGRGYCLSAIA